MKIVHCEVCDLYVWDRKVVKAFYKFQLNNICPNCRSYGSLRREKIKQKDLETIGFIDKRDKREG